MVRGPVGGWEEDIGNPPGLDMAGQRELMGTGRDGAEETDKSLMREGSM